MSRPVVFLLASAALLLAACSNKPLSLAAPGPEQSAPELTGKVQAAGIAGLSGLPIPAQSACPIPAGWNAYQVQINETVYSIAAQAGISAADLIRANCASTAATFRAGGWLYVPPGTRAAAPHTLLPLGISAFIADPLVVPAGGTVRFAWQAMGPVVGVRLGWVYGDRFIEEAVGLPAGGGWQVQVPADGRTSITYMIRVSDGLQEVAAQVTIGVMCPEGWFFSPPPADCPLPALATTLHEQSFERGSIIYVPALRVHYVLLTGQPTWQVADKYVPGMPLREPDPTAVIPAGLREPSGPIYYAWHGLAGELGYATGDEQTYAGMHQRAVSASGETLAFSATWGRVVVITPGGAWQVVVAQ